MLSMYQMGAEHILMDSLIFATGDEPFKKLERLELRSVFTNTSFPGYLFVEAPSLDHVQHAFKTIPAVPSRALSITQISLHDAGAILTMRGGRLDAQDVSPNTWVRLRRGGIYKDDLAFVQQVDDEEYAYILLIPRLFALGDVNRSLTKRKRFSRPHPALFDHHAVINSAPNYEELDSKPSALPKQISQDIWQFDGETFWHGLCRRKVALRSLNLAPVEPSVEELLLWMECPVEEVKNSIATVKRRLDSKRKLEIWPNDQVAVEATGFIGTVLQVDDSDAINTSSSMVAVQAPLTGHVEWHAGSDLRKHIVPGDYVSVAFGEHSGLSGWVVASEAHIANIMLSSQDMVRSVTLLELHELNIAK